MAVNDASTDKSLKILTEYASNYPQIKIIDKPHGGLGDTRNYGLQNALGEYVGFVDSDDWVDKDMFETMYNAAALKKSDIVICNYVREDMANKESRPCNLPQENDEAMNASILTSLIGPDPVHTDWRNVEMLGCAWRRLYRKIFLADNKLNFYNEQEVMLEDLPMNIKAHYYAKNVVLVPNAFYHYRYNPYSLSTNYRKGKMKMLVSCYNIINDFLKSEKIFDIYGERLQGWLLRHSAHSSLVNAFSKYNKVSFIKRYREVKEIVKNKFVRSAVKSKYFNAGTREDRIISAVLRTNFTLFIYCFYKLFTSIYMKTQKR